MLERIKILFGLKSAGITWSEFVRLTAGGEVTRLKDYHSYMEAGLKKVWATFKAIDLIAQEVASTPFKITAKGSTKPVTDSKLLKLFSKPNPYLNFRAFLYLLTFHLRLTGNAYVYKGGMNGKGVPESLWPLNPKRVEVKPFERNFGIQKFVYRSGGQTVDFLPEEVIHIKRPHPNNDYMGMGDIEAGEALFNSFLNRQSWEEGFWKNGASPSGVLINEDVITDQEKWKKAKQKFQDEYGGKENSGKTAWLTGKWRYEQLGLSVQEMQDIEKSKLAVEEIFCLHGVPLSVAGVRDAANYATAEVDDRRFRRYAVLPNIKSIEDSFNEELLPAFNENFILAFELAGLLNVGEILTQYSGLFDRGGMTINELREKVNLPRNDENPQWNEPFINAGLIPLALSGIADLGMTDKAAERIISRFVDGIGAKTKR